MSSYSKFVSENSIDIHCYSKKLTLSQTERVERLSDEILSLSAPHNRVFIFLMQEAIIKSFHYRPTFKESPNKGETLWSDHQWPGAHEATLEFQKETGQHGLIGLHGFPADFVEKVKSGEAVQKIEAINKANS
jgi:hypothetical protein